jgi:hypothetical protein
MIHEPIVQQPTPRAIRYDVQQQQQHQTTVRNAEPRRSTRTRQPPDRLIYNAYLDTAKQQQYNKAVEVVLAYRKAHVNEHYVAAYTAQVDEFDGGVDYVDPGVYLHLSQRAEVHVSRSTNVPHNATDIFTRAPPTHNTPSVFISSVDKDTFRFHEAMLEPDWEEFLKAAVFEVTTLEQMSTWIEELRSSVPANHRVLDGTWIFRRKRNPEGKVIKYKARYCVRGDQQIAGIDYFDSYAPVTMWYTIRMMFILSIIYDWHSVQVDYTNAFAQAYLKELVYIEIPRGFTASKPNMVLRLIKSLYGLVQAPKTFYDLLTSELTRCGYVSQPNIDPCLWINKKRKIICVIWVDDCLFFCKDKEQINQSINELKKNMPLTMEDSVTAFLGIKVERNKSGYKLSQPGLIAKIIEASDLKDCNAVRTPAATTPLGADPNGERHNEKWEYNSVVGMLMFLANNTRPDIAYAVHQCARFSHSPKAIHSLAVKRIVRYLKGTPTDGMIMHPKGELVVDCYVDADFAGLYGTEDSQDPICAKSRTGYVLLLAGCPLMWVSKLQSEIASSTMESEYIALSQAMRDLIPVRRLLQLICDSILPEQSQNARMYSSVFEDNNGALQLARAPRITPRTKHYAIKYHFFRENVKAGDIKLFKVESCNQKADIFTKGLVLVIFETIRKLLIGW